MQILVEKDQSGQQERQYQRTEKPNPRWARRASALLERQADGRWLRNQQIRSVRRLQRWQASQRQGEAA